MIRCFWRTASGDHRGRTCIVYSTLSHGELMAWADEHEVPMGWRRWAYLNAERECERFFHFELFGQALGKAPPVTESVTAAEFAADRCWWRDRAEALNAFRPVRHVLRGEGRALDPRRKQGARR